MEVADSARRHGVLDDDVRAAVSVALAAVRRDDRVLYIGADTSGRLLEVVVLDPEEDPVAIHAMPLRRKFYRYL